MPIRELLRLLVFSEGYEFIDSYSAMKNFTGTKTIIKQSET